jgi:hypothetical protein
MLVVRREVDILNQVFDITLVSVSASRPDFLVDGRPEPWTKEGTLGLRNATKSNTRGWGLSGYNTATTPYTYVGME